MPGVKFQGGWVSSGWLPSFQSAIVNRSHYLTFQPFHTTTVFKNRSVSMNVPLFPVEDHWPDHSRPLLRIFLIQSKHHHCPHHLSLHKNKTTNSCFSLRRSLARSSPCQTEMFRSRSANLKSSNFPKRENIHLFCMALVSAVIGNAAFSLSKHSFQHFLSIVPFWRKKAPCFWTKNIQ